MTSILIKNIPRSEYSLTSGELV